MSPEHDPHCAECGYDLSGLRRSGECPECGAHFDLISGRGVRTQSRAAEKHHRGERLARRMRTVLLVVAAIMVLLCGGMFVPLAEHWYYPMATAAVIALVVAMGAVTSYLYEQD